jgi:ectoine hydroxylase-related dioxygenase (phytanoyl-CoA dioxygenase family)
MLRFTSMRDSSGSSRNRLSTTQRNHWQKEGFLIFPSFFSGDEIEVVNSLVNRRIQNPDTFGSAGRVDAIAGPHMGKRFRATEAPREVFEGPIKINDLFIDEPEVRNLALNERLSAILSEVLGSAPMICNSLNFIWGSQQPAHCDSWFMPPPSRFAAAHARGLSLRIGPARAPLNRIFEFLKTQESPAPQRLVVSSICLEDVHPDAGPLTYYPGSHKIPPYRFSHGGFHAVNEELPACRAYMEQQIQQAGLKPLPFIGKAGDVFLWHGGLLHGGAKINEHTRTRKTLVTHYWCARDVPAARRVRLNGNGFYLKREDAGASELTGDSDRAHRQQ